MPSDDDHEYEVYGFVLSDKFVYTRKDSRYFNRAIVADVKHVDIREGSTSANPALQVGFAVVLILIGAILFMAAMSSMQSGEAFSPVAMGGSPALMALAGWMIYDSRKTGWIVTFHAEGRRWRFVADERCTRRELRDIAEAFTKRYGWQVATSFL